MGTKPPLSKLRRIIETTKVENCALLFQKILKKSGLLATEQYTVEYIIQMSIFEIRGFLLWPELAKGVWETGWKSRLNKLVLRETSEILEFYKKFL